MPASYGPVNTNNAARAGNTTQSYNDFTGIGMWLAIVAVVLLAGWLLWLFFSKGG